MPEQSLTRIERHAARLSVFLGGAALMAAEVAAFRIIGTSFGTAVRETTAVIAVFLAAMSVGYWAGGRIGDRWPKLSTLAAILLASAASLFCIPWLDAYLTNAVATSSLRPGLHAFAATLLLFAIPTALLACVSPIAIRLFATSTIASGSTAGSISAISTAGSIAGSIATAFFLLDWLESITRTVLFLAAITCGAALILAIVSLPDVTTARRYAIRCTAGASVAAVMIAAFVRSSHIDPSFLQPAAGWNVLFTGDSAYHHINVRERVNRYRILTFGLGIQTLMNVHDPFGPGVPYTDAMHIGPLIRPWTRRVLVIGLGGGTAAKQYRHNDRDVTVDAVEIDPVVVNVAKQFFEVRPDDRLRIHVGDGRQFLRNATERWDLIIVDAYTTNRYGATIPPHLVTREFFQEAAAHLNTGGVMHFHCAFSETRLLPALEKTMATVFTTTLTTGGEIIASTQPIVETQDELLARVAQSPEARLPTLTTYVRGLHPSSKRDDAPLLTDDYAPIESLLDRR